MQDSTLQVAWSASDFRAAIEGASHHLGVVGEEVDHGVSR